MTVDGMTFNFASLLKESVRIHGHICPGQVLGVRMAMKGLAQVGIRDPRGEDRKKLYLFVEIDRCATDALQSVTGCSLGKRSMRFMDYGKMAATFVNLSTDTAVRVFAKDEARDKAKDYFPEIKDKYQCQLEAYKVMPDEDLFLINDVTVSIAPEDMPGRPHGRVRCTMCNEHVQDKREVLKSEQLLCQACANGRYYGIENYTHG